MRLVISGLLASFLLALAPPVGAAQATEMSKPRARSYYLQVVCPHQVVVDGFNRELFRGRDTVSGQEIRRRLPELRRMSARLSRSFQRVARQMENSPRPWPAEIDADVETFVDLSVDTAYYARRMADADNARGFIGHYERAVRASRRGERIAGRVTAYLNIGRRACAGR